MALLAETETVKYTLLTLFIGWWLYWLWTRRNLYRFALECPGSFGIPLLGILYRISHPKDIIPVFSSLFAESKSKSVCIWVGTNPMMLTSDPVIIEKVLSSPELLDKAKIIYQPLYEALKGGLIAIPVKHWHHNRKLLNPSFNHKVLISFLPIFHKAKKQILNKFDALVGTGEHNIYHLIQQSQLGISIETTMGKIMQENDEVDIDLVKQFTFLMGAVVNHVILTFVKLQWIFFFYQRYHKTKNYLHNFVNELIMSKLQSLHEKENIGDGSPSTTLKTAEPEDSVLSIKKTPTIFIDQAIQFYVKQQLTLNDVIAESNTFIAASFETAANAIFSILIMLAMHPEVQEKCYEEIVGVFPEKDFEMEFKHMQQLPYLEMVMNETLRLTPSVPLIARQVVKDTQLTKDILLPKDLQIMISIYHLHRSTDIWGPDAHKFNPDNFLPANLAEKHSHAFMPFSKGARSCIGWRYALFVMNVLLAGLIRNLKFTTTFKFEDLKCVEHIGLKYLIDPEIEIHRR